MSKLGLNVDHFATVRQARLGAEPDPVIAAAIGELAGAEGITIHLREDRRHIQDRDLEIMRKTVKTKLNLEMAASNEMVDIACRIKPDQCTLVPEDREELTTEGGLDVVAHLIGLSLSIDSLHKAGITVSLFIDPAEEQINAAYTTNADAIEIHTGRYADAPDSASQKREFEAIRDAIAVAKKMGLTVHAGHGLNYTNIHPLLELKDIEEFNIGHSIVARAMYVGLDQAVRDMVKLIRRQ
jgi:pyridoxine 5-phosphate synthase